MTPIITLGAYSILLAILLTITIIDFRTMRIPNPLIILGISLGMLYRIGQAFYIKDIRFISRGVVGFMVGASIIALIMLFSLLVFRKEGMGMGDLKLLAMIGLFLGSRQVIYTILVAVLLGGLYAAIIRMTSKKEMFPFGPFLSIGALVAMVWGDHLWQVYIRWIGI